MSTAFETKPKARWLALSPALIVIGIFMVGPTLIMLVYSFLEANPYGGVYPVFSTEAYVQLLYELDLDDSLVFNPAYLIIIARSVGLALITTALGLLIGFPVAYYIARQPAHRRNFLVFLVTIPFWTNLLVRTFAWIIILGRGGVIETPLLALGILGEDETLGLLYTNGAILTGLTYTYLPLMVLPIYASLEKVDFRLMEAAADLYASRWTALFKVVVPLALPGIVAGCILVFVPALGDFISPDLLGGAKRLMLGSLIQFQFATARNWPFGAAVAMVLLAFVMINLMIYARVAQRRANIGGLGSMASDIPANRRSGTGPTRMRPAETQASPRRHQAAPAGRHLPGLRALDGGLHDLSLFPNRGADLLFLQREPLGAWCSPNSAPVGMLRPSTTTTSVRPRSTR